MEAAAGCPPVIASALGIGLALVDLDAGEVRQGYQIEGGAQAARELATAVAEVRFGIDRTREERTNAMAREIRDDLTASGNPPPPPINRQVPSISDGAPVDLSSLANPHSSLLSPEPDWALVRTALERAGLRASSREESSRLLRSSGPCSVFELTDHSGKVLAEGRGETDAAALRGALGEGVERLVASTVEDNVSFIATPSDLAGAGVRTLHLSAAERDLFGTNLPLQWLPASTLEGQGGALPLELAQYPCRPASGVKAFSVQHTAGLASGGSRLSATLAGLREAIETDAYWLSSLCRRVDAMFFPLVDGPETRVRARARALADQGIATHAALISFGWPMPVVHVVLENRAGSLPALSHGLASGFDPVATLDRALMEAIQVFTGLEKISDEYWPEISVGLERRSQPQLAWADPNHTARVLGIFHEAPKVGPEEAFDVPIGSDLRSWMAEQGMTTWTTCLGGLAGLEVARVVIDGAASPFSERGPPSLRLQRALASYGLRDPYLDPVLT